MKKILVIALFLLFGCGGKLTEEQRRKARKDMNDHAIKKVSEAQIIEAAFATGRTIATVIELRSIENAAVVDSLQTEFNAEITALVPANKSMSDIERQLVEAYENGAGKTELTDNVQKIGKDTLLYTKPIMKKQRGGSQQFLYAIGIKIAKRSIVLSIK